jgi:hypothetical protein
LRGQAKAAGCTTAEYLRLYALEGFLLRLSYSPHRSTLVLLCGVLLAVFELRRPTADVDFAAVQIPNDAQSVRRLVADVAATTLPAGLDDGLTWGEKLSHPSSEVEPPRRCQGAKNWKPFQQLTELDP